MRRSRSSEAWLSRQMMYRRIMPACSLRLAWPVPPSVKYRSAVNCASTRFNQDELAGGQAISTLSASARVPTRRSLRAPRCGLKLPQMIATRVKSGQSERRVLAGLPGFQPLKGDALLAGQDPQALAADAAGRPLGDREARPAWPGSRQKTAGHARPAWTWRSSRPPAGPG